MDASRDHNTVNFKFTVKIRDCLGFMLFITSFSIIISGTLMSQLRCKVSCFN